MHRELSQTLLEIVEAVRADDGAGIHVTGADIELPLEVALQSIDGRPVFCARAPHTRWKSGVLQPLSRTRIRVVREEA